MDTAQKPSNTAGLVAYGDESFHEDQESGFYVLATVVFDNHNIEDEARDCFRAMRGPRSVAKLHWNEMDRSQQRRVAKRLADFDGLHVVVTGEPVPRRRQERARSQCLKHLIYELHGYGVRHLILEAREEELNHADSRTTAGVRQSDLPKGSQLRIDHVHGANEPLLWAADVVAGSCRAAREGKPEPRSVLAERIYEIPLDTEC
ncbi:hypothetical protein SAMN04487904_106144 [Actinopolyspora lacussalsi subsp. righensis]|uniref:DUF3800 domain-containing protein n=1 Tax=Actinopolyspora righensis TaxID=995060 RepID=A0A1I7A8Y9_9ACTN|nr:DUF3800 domain-containing protein [Actinopolyspora righensis]SFT71368.1 hypothetical protein SAMN04487904_106144 [Actinopolyspora righensis]